MANAIVPGSLGAIAQQDNKSLAETFLGAEVIVIVDTSASMSEADTEEGISRYDKACQELMKLQQAHSGKVAVIGFSNTVQFYPGGVPTFLMGDTQMIKALNFTKIVDLKGVQFFLISDGQPTDGQEYDVIEVAKTYQNKINTIYCGPEGGSGQRFLARLAQASGGKFATADRVKELASTVETMLLEG